MTNSSTQITLNDTLVEVDNVLKGLNMLYEEIQTRKAQILADVDVTEKVKCEMDTERFKSTMHRYVDGYWGNELISRVATSVMRQIDGDIERFITTRVNEALVTAGVQLNIPSSTSNTSSSSVDTVSDSDEYYKF